jgi:pimeloyl-ACP methyl ester carboxylesterase
VNAPGLVAAAGHDVEFAWFEPTARALGAPPIVMLHEGLGSVAMWRDFPVQLADATGCRVVAYSRPGHGRSAAPQGRRDPLTAHEAEARGLLPAFIERLGIARPILFGHSDGASIALIYAALAPLEVTAVIAMAPHVTVEDMCLARIRDARQAFLSTDLRQKLGRYHADADAMFWGWNDMWLAPSFRRWSIERYLADIVCPVLAIQGKQDEYGTMAQLDSIVGAAPHAQLLALADCRHSPHRDQPGRVLEATAAFIGRSLS